MHIMIKQALNL